MRDEPMKRTKQEKKAIAGFVIAVIIALAAFYYIWQAGIQYGRTIEGTRALGEIMWKRQQLQAEMPTVPEELMTKRAPCCVFVEHPLRGSQLKVDVVEGSCVYDPLVKELIERGGFKITDIEDGECPKKIAG